MIHGETLSDGVLILQRVEHANLSGMFFFGGCWIRIASGCIVDASCPPKEIVSLLYFGFKSVKWNWFRTDDTTQGKYFQPLSLVVLGKIDHNTRFTKSFLPIAPC
jgi:hypothetical protein